MLACAFAMLAGPQAGLSVVDAQPPAHAEEKKAPAGKASKPRGESKPARQRRAKRASARRKSAAKAAAPAPEAATLPVAGASPSSAGGEAEVASAAQVHTEGGTQVKVMEFRGLDIEGQLKTPQMLYFLNRMRAEFGRPRLPHRSFMPELEHSAEERAF
jgi:hypothetical protein